MKYCLLPFLPVALLCACDQSLDIPFNIESPAQEIDATSQIESLEASLCSDASSENCVILKAVDYSDDQQVSSPPSIPAEFPTTVELVDPATGIAIPDENGDPQNIDVLAWLDEVGADHELDLAQAIDVDIRDEAQNQGIDPALIENVSIASFAMNWTSNSLTFDTVDLDVYVSSAPVADSSDPAALIASGDVELIGRLPAQSAETTGEAAIAFVDGGNDKLNTALRNLAFTMVMALPDGASVELKDGSAPGSKRKPTGKADVSVKATVVYTITTPAFPL